MTTCCVCGREQKDIITLKLTEVEKAYAKKVENLDVDSFSYCRACYRILCDREQGARLIQGVVQTNMASLGASNADVLAKRLYEHLIKHAKPSST